MLLDSNGGAEDDDVKKSILPEHQDILGMYIHYYNYVRASSHRGEANGLGANLGREKTKRNIFESKSLALYDYFEAGGGDAGRIL
jgi:hypothetical protein